MPCRARSYGGIYGHSGRRHFENEKTAPLRFLGVGGTADRRGLPPEMCGVRTPDYDSASEGGEERAGCEAWLPGSTAIAGRKQQAAEANASAAFFYPGFVKVS